MKRGRILSEDRSLAAGSTLVRADALAMIACLLMWAGIASYSLIVNGDVFLLFIPLIFKATTILIYLITSSFKAGAPFGAASILTANALFVHGYPI